MSQITPNLLCVGTYIAGAQVLGIQDAIPPVPKTVILLNPDTMNVLSVTIPDENELMETFVVRVRRALADDNSRHVQRTVRVKESALMEIYKQLTTLTNSVHELLEGKTKNVISI